MSHETLDREKNIAIIVEELRSRMGYQGILPKQTSIDNSSWVTVQEFDTATFGRILWSILPQVWFNQKDLAVQSSLISLREVWGGTHVWGITIQSCVFSGFNMFMIGDCIPLQTTWLTVVGLLASFFGTSSNDSKVRQTNLPKHAPQWFSILKMRKSCSYSPLA
jgi:hypothetical protein